MKKKLTVEPLRFKQSANCFEAGTSAIRRHDLRKLPWQRCRFLVKSKYDLENIQWPTYLRSNLHGHQTGLGNDPRRSANARTFRRLGISKATRHCSRNHNPLKWNSDRYSSHLLVGKLANGLRAVLKCSSTLFPSSLDQIDVPYRTPPSSLLGCRVAEAFLFASSPQCEIPSVNRVSF